MKLRLPNGELFSSSSIKDIKIEKGFITISKKESKHQDRVSPSLVKFESDLTQDEVDKVWSNLVRYSRETIMSWDSVVQDILN